MRPKFVYVAGKWEERDRVREVQDKLSKAGYEISHDWTIYEQESGKTAQDDILGVIYADAFVGVFEKDLPYCGSLMEFGAALAANLPCYILGKAPITKYMFFKHPNVKWGIEELIHAR